MDGSDSIAKRRETCKMRLVISKAVEMISCRTISAMQHRKLRESGDFINDQIDRDVPDFQATLCINGELSGIKVILLQRGRRPA